MKITKRIWISCLTMLLSASTLLSQEVSIELGKNQIGINQYFTITVKIENDRLKQSSEFPIIEGFIKRGTSSSTTTNYINGRMSSSQSITQNYQARDQGTFVLAPFTMTVNGKEVSSEGTSITVGEAIQRQSRRDPFDDFFGRRSQPAEFIDVEADAFLALTLDKDEVYVGEGFTATLAFYVAETNRADMRFYDLATQITEIMKKIKPGNCWEENFTIDHLTGEAVTVNGKNYDRYRIHQTTYYPLTTDNIEFPSVGLDMIKYKVAKNPTFFGTNRQEGFETFYSKARRVNVKELPPHPLKQKVAVGNYRLEEFLSEGEVQTGQGINFQFQIIGEGNISSIEAPDPRDSDVFDFYAPNVTQQVNRANGRVRGAKTFDFYAIPNEPGTYALADFFRWIYFNPVKEAYDTLVSNYSLNVTGESRKNLTIASSDPGDFYGEIESADNSLKALGRRDWMTILVNVFIVITLGMTGFLLFKKSV